MSGTGVSLQDAIPFPEKSVPITGPEQKEEARAMVEMPTASHVLAQAEPDAKGFAQEAHDDEVMDLGWNKPKEKVPEPLVGGLHDNEELWLLVRRFNMQMYHVKETLVPVPGNLDMNVADEDEFSPDKLRSTIERLYMTVGIGLLGFVKHIMRLRSWREQRRTTCFCAAYFLAWLFDFLVPLFSITMIVLIAFPPSRQILFPPAPIALVGKDGAPQTPKAGVLGSHDSATGAPENHKGEAVEAEAQNFVASIAHVALSSATGKHPQNDPPTEEDGEQSAIPDPSKMALSASNARQKTTESDQDVAKDKTKVPMEAAIWSQMRPAMHALNDIADTWERFANALSPTPPFPRDIVRLRLAALVVPVLAMSLLVTAYMYNKSVSFGIGFGFFGDPVIQPGLEWLNKTYPNWKKLLEVRNTILKGVPTNAQLTVTLLRVGEANKAPLPPPPHIALRIPKDEAKVRHDSDLAASGGDAPLGATQAELDEAAAPEPGVASETGGADIDASKDTSHGHKGSKVLTAIRGSVKASVQTALGVDAVKASAGNTPAKNRLGAIPPRNVTLLSGPIDFKARYKGKKGHVYITSKATIPAVSFTTDPTVERIGSQEREDLHPVWSVAVADIAELKKIGGFGWKAKIVVGWALDREVADGLEIIEKNGATWKVTAMPLRDELFNRLVAMGGQKWESW